MNKEHKPSAIIATSWNGTPLMYNVHRSAWDRADDKMLSREHYADQTDMENALEAIAREKVVLSSDPELCTVEDAEDNRYTVILLYPAGTTANYGQDTWTSWAVGSTPEEAIAWARREYNENRYGNEGESGEMWDSDDDLYCIACIEGHHQDARPEK